MEAQQIAIKFTEVINAGLDRFEQTVSLRLFRSLLSMKAKLNPTWMIESAGPFFFKHREQIAGRDLDYFLTLDFGEQRRDWVELTKGYGESTALAFESHLKESLRVLKETDPRVLETVPLQLLKMYARYVQLSH